ncbi:MAG: hypothetical protein PVSMB8_02600 [Vulcanimicrobiaceae bacterium]
MRIVTDGALEDTLVNIQKFNHTREFELLEKEYLGELTGRKDEIYKGVKGSFEMHLHTARWEQVKELIKTRSQRKTPSIVFDIVQVLQFPSGETLKRIFPDIAFGPIEEDASARGDYVHVKVQFATSDTQGVAA